MFKYVKTMGAHAAAPEIEEMYMDSFADVPAGTVLFHNGESLTANATTENQDEPKYFLVEKYEYARGPHSVKAFRINKGMLFTATDLPKVDIGSTLLLGSNGGNSGYDHVSTIPGHGARITMSPYHVASPLIELDW